MSGWNVGSFKRAVSDFLASWEQQKQQNVCLAAERCSLTVCLLLDAEQVTHTVKRALRLNQNSWSETRLPHTWPAGFHFSFSSNRNTFPSINSSCLILVVLFWECFLLLKVFSVWTLAGSRQRKNISGPQRGEIISMSMIRRPEHKLINSAVARRPDERAAFVLFAL